MGIAADTAETAPPTTSAPPTAATTEQTQMAPPSSSSLPTSRDGSVALGMRCELLSAGGGSGSGLRASIKRYGEVAYIGAVRGLPAGEWIGVRLDKPLGKNDGSVDGERYFRCAHLHGAFVRREKLNTVGDFPVLATHAESIEHAMEARRKALDDKKQLDRQQRATDQEQSADELMQRFWQRFAAHERDVRRQLDVFVEQQQQPTPCEPAQAVQLDALVLRIGAMRDDAASAASMYLSPYDIRQSQLLVAKLLELVETTRATFAPRKKFAFRARAKRVAGGAASGDALAASNNSGSSAVHSGARSTEQPETPSLTTPDALDSTSRQTDSHNQSRKQQQEQQQEPHTSQQLAMMDELAHADLQDQVIVIDQHSFASEPGTRRDLSFSRLRNCVVLVCVDTSAIRCDDLQQCVVLAGPVWGSVWLERCDACDFVVACRQLRVHHSVSTSFHLRISSHPIIEDCAQLQFGPYRLRYDGLDEQLALSGLAQDSGLWARVHDFKWHRAQQSPNWRVREPAQPMPVLPPALASRASLG